MRDMRSEEEKMKSPVDRFQRSIDYMRISVTDRCNLRCIYCMPEAGTVPIPHSETLKYEEIVSIVRAAVGMGLRKIRITGGEPLVRKNITHLIRLLSSMEGIEDLSLTTNGIFLAEYVEELAEAGLHRVNISLDSLKPDRYREITRGGDIERVFKGIEAVQKAGLVPIKINMVPIRNLNDDEVGDFALMTLLDPYQVRFIEFMPFCGRDAWSPERVVPAEEIQKRIEKLGALRPAKTKKSGPARYFAFEGAAGVIGFISPLSNHFCSECNRLRLTADGKLRPCLFSETEIDLKSAVRGGGDDMEIRRLISLAIAVKPEGHNMEFRETLLGKTQKKKDSLKSMSKIGG